MQFSTNLQLSKVIYFGILFIGLLAELPIGAVTAVDSPKSSQISG